MTDENNEETTDITAPSEPTHEATTPPGENEPDAERVEDAKEQIDKVGGGH
jgi:hypothetical protein